MGFIFLLLKNTSVFYTIICMKNLSFFDGAYISLLNFNKRYCDGAAGMLKRGNYLVY